MGETSTNIAMLNMDDALKVRVKDGCDVGDPCASSPCPQHSRCRDAWDSYACVCNKGESPSTHCPFTDARPWMATLLVFRRHREKLKWSVSFRTNSPLARGALSFGF